MSVDSGLSLHPFGFSAFDNDLPEIKTPDVSGGGIVSDDAPPADIEDPEKKRKGQYLSVLSRLFNSAISSYGNNSWQGTPSAGLSAAQPRMPGFSPASHRTPILGYKHDGTPIFSRLIDGSTHMANPPKGLIGGNALQNWSRPDVDKSSLNSFNAALTPRTEWDAMFHREQASQPTIPARPTPTTDWGQRSNVGTSGVVNKQGPVKSLYSGYATDPSGYAGFAY